MSCSTTGRVSATLAALGAIAFFVSAAQPDQPDPNSKAPTTESVRYIESLVPGPLEPQVLRATLGEPDAYHTGRELYEGFRRGRLAALCTETDLASAVPDRTLRVGNLRTEHYFVYDRLGATFLFLDNPWTLYRFVVTHPLFTIGGIQIGASVAEIDRHYGGIGQLCDSSTDSTRCCERWTDEGIRAYYDCSPQECQDLRTWPDVRLQKQITKLEVYDTTLPTGCWFSFRGQYMPWTLEDSDFQ